jgi:hypothetical protein
VTHLAAALAGAAAAFAVVGVAAWILVDRVDAAVDHGEVPY